MFNKVLVLELFINVLFGQSCGYENINCKDWTNKKTDKETIKIPGNLKRSSFPNI